MPGDGGYQAHVPGDLAGFQAAPSKLFKTSWSCRPVDGPFAASPGGLIFLGPGGCNSWLTCARLLGGRQFLFDQLGEFLLFIRQGRHGPIHFRHFRLQVGKLRRCEPLLDRYRRFRGQTIRRQDFTGFDSLSGVDPQGRNGSLKGHVDAPFQGAEQFAVKDYFGVPVAAGVEARVTGASSANPARGRLNPREMANMQAP